MEEKIYFQSNYTYDLDAHKEFNRVTRNAVGATGFMNCLSALCILYLMTAGVGNFAMILLLILGLFYLVTWAVRWHTNRDGGVAYKRILHSNEDQPPHQIVTLEEEGVRGHNPKTDNRIFDPYENFRYMMETKHLLILVTDLRMCHIIDKRSLTGGDRDELIAFLRSRCPKLKKKIKTGKFGQFSQYFQFAMVAIGVLLALINLLNIPQWLSGQISNRMSYTEIAQELEQLDIRISPETLQELEAYEAEYGHSVYPEASKVLDLMVLEGMGQYDWDTWEWTPSTSGLYWFDMEVINLESIYTDFLRGIGAMDEALVFSNIAEDYSLVDLEAGTGDVTFSFDYLGQTHVLEAVYNYDWFDTDMLYAVGRILADDGQPENLWMTFDGQAILLYYGTENQVRTLETKTGLTFLDCVTMRMGH